MTITERASEGQEPQALPPLRVDIDESTLREDFNRGFFVWNTS